MTDDDAPVLLVTGGSRGIGAAICMAAAQHGWAVAVNYASNKEAAEAVVGTILDAGGEAIAVAGDVGKPEDIKAIFAKVDAYFGRIDGLVNNAGVVDVIQRLDEMTPERLDRMFRINIRGTMLAAAEAVRRMSTLHGGKGGVIVNISSMSSTLGGGGQYVDYAASKGAIDTFTIGLAREVAAEGIRVNAVRPGIIDTDIHATAGRPDRAREVAPQLPMKRVGTSDEVADAVLYLLSPHASYITGALLDVSGGR